jgi:hypothetical protein
MQLRSDFARRAFRIENADLLHVDYWLEVQDKLLRGEVPELRMYPRSCRLRTDTDESAATPKPVSG